MGKQTRSLSLVVGDDEASGGQSIGVDLLQCSFIDGCAAGAAARCTIQNRTPATTEPDGLYSSWPKNQDKVDGQSDKSCSSHLTRGRESTLRYPSLSCNCVRVGSVIHSPPKSMSFLLANNRREFPANNGNNRQEPSKPKSFREIFDSTNILRTADRLQLEIEWFTACQPGCAAGWAVANGVWRIDSISPQQGDSLAGAPCWVTYYDSFSTPMRRFLKPGDIRYLRQQSDDTHTIGLYGKSLTKTHEQPANTQQRDPTVLVRAAVGNGSIRLKSEGSQWAKGYIIIRVWRDV
ncbi:hypothetical protein DAPPUDRAFT_95752 [Daphnia pulex]|uniref:Uncharacterized protein n=1 Tax=Daphnia pulex TaxID=6669 RepID=E9FUN6_DAPPU|nr:hypothetical protein DAPPUDRAFT_95752 [Daphnia pulex]|eukprot:EFX88893.1 hypothetical protein DAPPUDRAFT_95752 [Daphnia pulex]